MKQEIFVTCPRGLEKLLSSELTALGLEPRIGVSGVYLKRAMRSVYLVNYCSRIATRVLWPIARFRCRDKESLYRAASEVDWTTLLDLDKSFAIDANVSHRHLRNSLFAALVVKDALCDQLCARLGERPSVKVADPDVQLNLFIYDEIATISLDTSGAPLYKRGWREETGEAPIQEALAAAVLTLAGYSGKESLCDPFCGAGTLLMEAAMLSTRTPAGYFRKSWGFMHHPRFAIEEWEAIKKEADASRIPLEEGKLFGADKDPYAIELCKRHLAKLGCADAVDLQRRGIGSYRPYPPPSLVVTNPPYGRRLHTSTEYFRSLGKLVPPTTPCWLLAPNRSFIKPMERQIQQEFPLKSGGLDLYLFCV